MKWEIISPMMAHIFYDRDGNEIDLERWSELALDHDYKHLAHDEFGGYSVSTIWLGLNHNFWGGLPLIFETAVFGPSDTSEIRRYATEAEAIAGHAAVCEEVRLLVEAYQK